MFLSLKSNWSNKCRFIVINKGGVFSLLLSSKNNGGFIGFVFFIIILDFKGFFANVNF